MLAEMSLAAKYRILIAFCAALAAAALLAPRIAQDPVYHEFADQAVLLGIPNALNILSNLLLLWIGVEGLARLSRKGELRTLRGMRPAYFGFFGALILVAVASSWYHLAPDNARLAWDRAAMALAFMSYLSLLLAERVSLRIAQRLFPLLSCAGLASVAYWHYSELAGVGDLRAYLLVQLLPVALTPLLLTLFDSRYTRSGDLWWLLIMYLLAKLFEVFDPEIHALTGWIGGHPFKHLAAGLASLIFLRHLRRRSELET